VVVASLRFPARRISSTDACNSTRAAADTRTHRGSVTTADCTANERADHSACDRAFDPRFFLRTSGSLTANRVVGITTARAVILLKLVERPARTRKRQGARACRHSRATGKQCRCRQDPGTDRFNFH
jgi:hypothetical protein